MKHSPHTNASACSASGSVGRFVELIGGCIVLFGVGFYMFVLIGTGNLAHYVNVHFAWLYWFAAIGCIVLAAVRGWSAVAKSGHAHCCQTVQAWQLAALALPVFWGFVVPSKPLNSSAIRSSDPTVQQILRSEADMRTLVTPGNLRSPELLYGLYGSSDREPAVAPSHPAQWTLVDWLRLYAKLEDKASLEGMPVDLTGFVYRSGEEQDGEFFLTRFFMRHCMFDTIPIAMPVQWGKQASLQEDSWVRVQGNLRWQPAPVERLFIDALVVTPAKEPSIPYLYARSSRDAP